MTLQSWCSHNPVV